MSVEQDGPPPAAAGPTSPMPPAGGPAAPVAAAVARRRRRVVVAGALGLVVVVGGAAAVLLSGDDSPGKKGAVKTESVPSNLLREVAQGVSAPPGLRYEGTLTVAGKPVQARLRVTKAGSATGTLTAGALTADVVAVDGVTYVKAGLAFWRDYAGERSRPENYAGRWAKAPATLPGFDVPGVLGPGAIARLMAKAPPKPATETVRGTRAYRIRTAQADYLVAAAAPHPLLSVRAAGRTGAALTVLPVLNPPSMFAELRVRVAALGGAADPGLRFAPGRPEFGNCDQNVSGCTVSVPATLTSPEGPVPDGARAALRASITSKGRPLGTCTRSEPIPSGRTLTLRCTVAGKAWRTWMRAALDKPGSYPYAATARIVGEAVAPDRLPDLLAIVDRERGTAAKEPAGAPNPARP